MSFAKRQSLARLITYIIYIYIYIYIYTHTHTHTHTYIHTLMYIICIYYSYILYLYSYNNFYHFRLIGLLRLLKPSHNMEMKSMLANSNILLKLKKEDFRKFDEKFLCLYCHDILYEPVQTSCGHRLCRECVSDIKQSSKSTICPANEADCDDLSKSQVRF